MEKQEPIKIEEERISLIQSNLRLVGYTAGKMHLQLPSAMTREDVMQCGYIGLIDAALRYNSACGGRFSTYACCLIRGRILDGIRLYAGRSQIHEKEFSYEDLPEEQWENLAVHEPSSQESEDLYSDLPERIEQALSCLSPQQRSVIRLRYYQEQSIRQIAEEKGLSVIWIRRVHHAAIVRLRHLLSDTQAHRQG